MADIKDTESVRFTEQHLWVKREVEHLRIGLSEQGQYLLGDVHYVGVITEAPKRAGQPIIIIETAKAAVEYALPFNVQGVRANPILKHAPQRVNESPENEAWLCQVSTTITEADWQALMSAADYEVWLDG